MSFLTGFFAVLYSVAGVVLFGGIAYRAWQYFRTPAPLKIPTTPAPTTVPGVVLRVTREVTVFESLFKSNKWLWIFGWTFHFGLFLVLLRHLRYVLEPVPQWVVAIQPFGKYASILMVVGLLGLFARRFVVDRVKYISAPSDYLMLLLLLGIGISGTLMTFAATPDIVQLKRFLLGVMYFSWETFPANPLLVTHMLLVAILMLIFPFSKLLHAPGVFFSPTRNQVDNPREKRHVAKWAVQLEQKN